MDDEAYIAGYELGIDAGRREVIEWLKVQGDFEVYLDGYIEVSLVALKAKLDEWEIIE